MAANSEQQPQQECALVNQPELRLLMALPFGMLAIATALAVAVDSSSSTKVIEELGLAEQKTA